MKFLLALLAIYVAIVIDVVTGLNLNLYGYAGKWLMVDLGVTFPHESEPGADVVLPDLRFIVAERKNLVGLVLTHAHEDHVGAVIDLWPSLECPIFATPFTAGMLKTKLGEFGGEVFGVVVEISRQFAVQTPQREVNTIEALSHTALSTSAAGNPQLPTSFTEYLPQNVVGYDAGSKLGP